MCTWTRSIFERIQSYVHNVNLVTDDLSEWVLIALSIYLPFICRKWGANISFTIHSTHTQMQGKHFAIAICWCDEVSFTSSGITWQKYRSTSTNGDVWWLLKLSCGRQSTHSHLHGEQTSSIEAKIQCGKNREMKIDIHIPASNEHALMWIMSLSFWLHHDQKQWFPIEKFFCVCFFSAANYEAKQTEHHLNGAITRTVSIQCGANVFAPSKCNMHVNLNGEEATTLA